MVVDTDLIGDVTCNVANATPCFSFGAPGIELRLNGFTITGRADAVTGCGGASTAGEAEPAGEHQNIAIGLAGLPVPRAILSGSAMNMNS
jgi:hypothetical protein